MSTVDFAGVSPAPNLTGFAAVRTPALLVDPDRVTANVRAVVAQLHGDARRWRPHIKTAKLGAVMRQMLAEGITRFKCATTLELKALLDTGARDVLVSFPHVGPNAARIRELATAHPSARVAALIETDAHLSCWSGSGLALFLDLNPGMNRTGGAPDYVRVEALALAIGAAGCTFGGLHWYDGHMHSFTDISARDRAAHEGYERLAELVRALTGAGLRVPEVIVAGTPAAASAARYERFADWPTDVQVSPGTVVYNDTTSLEQIPTSWGLAAAVHVLTTVVSHPTPTRFTCDAGHKSVSADAGVPTCAVVGHPDWAPARPSEEHLPVDIPAGTPLPPIGTLLLLLPRHICPTVNNFDEALLVRGGNVMSVTPVSARGREGQGRSWADA
ncbi:MAG: alanine racemase [Gemmatimonadota bacterium]|nr:alanine racemase [Gemmatimonadota bacterium]